MTSPLAAPAPSRRVLISPSLFLVLRMRTFGSRTMYSSSAVFRCSAEAKTETCEIAAEGAQWVPNPQLLYACSLIRPRWHERALMRNRPQMTTSPTRYPTKKDQRKNWTISSHHQTRHLLMPHAANSNVSPEGIYIITHTGINFTFHLLFCTHRLFIITLRQTPDRLWP